jgi:spore maturation protein CgeB
VLEYFETTGENKELITFRNAEELQDLIRYYLVHETQRKAIVERGYQKVISCHTYDHRVAEMFRVISKFLT